jgi:DNA-binding XRE family transcriptional regulator
MSGELGQVTGAGGVTRFADNLVRLMGLHALTQNLAAQLLGVTSATMSAWVSGKSHPSLPKAVGVGELFQISTDRLTGATFTDLLEHELANPERFELVEERIRRGRSSLRAL